MAARPWETAYLDDGEENPSLDSTRRDGGYLEVEDEELQKKLFVKKQSSSLSEVVLREPSLSSSDSTRNPQAQSLPLSSDSFVQNAVVMPSDTQLEALPSIQPVLRSSTVTSSLSTPTQISPAQVSRLLKQTKSSSSRGSGTHNGAVEASDETMATGLQEGAASKEAQALQVLSPAELPTSKSNNRPTSKAGLNRRNFSGPLKGMYDNSMTGSPMVPSYMAATQSAKAKARSQSNPKLRPETEEKTSPISKRRTSLPAETKQNSIPWRSFRSSSTKVFSSVRESREGGG